MHVYVSEARPLLKVQHDGIISADSSLANDLLGLLLTSYAAALLIGAICPVQTADLFYVSVLLQYRAAMERRQDLCWSNRASQ